MKSFIINILISFLATLIIVYFFSALYEQNLNPYFWQNITVDVGFYVSFILIILIIELIYKFK